MKILALILAAGEGSRIKHLLSEDEPVKAMLKVGEKRIIEKALGALDGVEVDKAVLTFPSQQYGSLNRLIESYEGVTLLSQKAPHKKLPTMLELPFILFWQYHLSKDAKFLKSYDAILTMPCDLLFENADLENFVKLYERWGDHPLKRKIAVLSKTRQEGGRCDLFLKEEERIFKMQKFKGDIPNGWQATTQAGVYIFSKAMLQFPLGFLLGFKRNLALQYLLESDWEDFGNPENLARIRQAL